MKSREGIRERFQNWEKKTFSQLPEYFYSAFSEGKFSLLKESEFSAEVFSVEWKFTGKYTGEIYKGCPPTGENVSFEGSVVFLPNEKEVWSLPDLSEIPKFSIQKILQPYQIGKSEFGYSLHASSGNPNPPKVIALTWIYGKDNSEKDLIRSYSRQIVQEFQATEGFIGIVTGFAGLRGFTVTAWESEEALKAGLSQTHATAQKDFFSMKISPAVWTSVWNPIRMNRIWTRCENCGDANDVNTDPSNCKSCGHPLPERKTFW
ncbi:MAG: hypothetical protein H7A24_13800 [Leptospiraceae bacterium]|nr:hypothetical protein [Leptospiraceae bacterium]MCP5512953.1 hypothetical protein [Leptospiraceae bacterium]